MVELGSLDVRFTVAGLTELVNGLKSIEGALNRTTKAQKAQSDGAKKSYTDQAKALDELRARNARADSEELKSKQSNTKKQKALYDELYGGIDRRVKESIDKQVAQEERATRMMNAEFNKRGQAHMNSMRQMEQDQARFRARMTPLTGAITRGSQTAGLMLGGALSAGAGSFLYSAFDQAKELNTVAGQVAVASNIPLSEEQKKAGYRPMTSQEIKNKSREVANETGMNPADVAKGYLTMYQHGQPELAREFGPKIAKWAMAENLNPADLADTLQTLARQNPNLQKAKGGTAILEKMMMSLIGQGKSESTPIAEMASSLGGATSVASLFGTRGTAEGMANTQSQLAALMQVAMKGGATNASTAAQAIRGAFATLAGTTDKKLAKAGLKRSDIMDKAGNLLDPNTVLEALVSRTHGSPHAIEEVMGQKGMKLVQGLLPTYSQAETVAKGSGMGAVHKMLTDTEGTTATASLVEQDMKIIQDSNRIQITAQQHINHLAQSIDDHIPQITSAMDTFGGIMEHLPVALGTTLTALPIGSAMGKLIGAGISQSMMSNASGMGRMIGNTAGLAMIPLLAGIGAEIYSQSRGLMKDLAPMTAKEIYSGTSAQHAPTPYDKNQNADIVDKFFVKLGAFIVNPFNVPVHDSVAGPHGSNLPGSHK